MHDVPGTNSSELGLCRDAQAISIERKGILAILTCGFKTLTKMHSYIQNYWQQGYHSCYFNSSFLFVFFNSAFM